MNYEKMAVVILLAGLGVFLFVYLCAVVFRPPLYPEEDENCCDIKGPHDICWFFNKR